MANSNSESFAKAKLWDLPTVDDDLMVDETKTNALNKPKYQWKYESPEQEEDIKPLTAQDIAAIRDAAYQEGLLNGHEEGYEKGKAEGFEVGKSEGFEVGKEEGLTQGLDESQKQINEKLSVLNSLIDNLQKPSAQINDDLKKELVLLSISIAKSIVDIEITQDEKVLMHAISEGIKTLPVNEAKYQLSLNPQDINLLQSQLSQEELNDKNWQLLEDVNLARGGCTIQCSSNAVDVSIEKRSQKVIAPILLSQGLSDDPRAK